MNPTFLPFRHSGGDIQERFGTPGGFVWQTIGRDAAWGLLMQQTVNAEDALRAGDKPNAERIARTAKALYDAIQAEDRWTRASRPAFAANVTRLSGHRLHSIGG